MNQISIRCLLGILFIVSFTTNANILQKWATRFLQDTDAAADVEVFREESLGLSAGSGIIEEGDLMSN